MRVFIIFLKHLLTAYYMQKPQSMWWLLSFINTNIEIKNKKIACTQDYMWFICGLKDPPFLHKTGIAFFWVKRMDIAV